MGAFGEVENNVLFGAEGELFLAAGGHQVLEYSTGAKAIRPEAVSAFKANMQGRHSDVMARGGGMTFRHVIFPDKQSVLSELFITPNPVRMGPIFAAALPDPNVVLYPLSVLQQAGRQAFLRMDTHLADHGAILIVTELVAQMKQADLTAHRDALLSLITLEREHTGDLGSKLTPPRSALERFARTPWRRFWAQNEIPGGNNGGVDIYVSPDAVYQERLIWFGDSFGRQAVRFLTYFFSEIVFLRTPFYHPEFVELMQPDHVVSGNVERYLGNYLSDEGRPAFMVYPFLTGREYKPSPNFAEAFSAMLSYPRTPYRQFIAKTLAQLNKPG